MVQIQMNMHSEIELRNVSHAFETPMGSFDVIKDLDLNISQSAFVSVVGPSGCGKSTLTRLISGLLKPIHGEIWLSGKRVDGPRPNVGMAFQNPVMLEWRNVMKNITLPLEIVASSMPSDEQENRAMELLKLVSLEGYEYKKPSELSGGMKQRVSLCRSLVHRPQVLILDEPFGALDAFTREELWQIMHALRSKEKFTCLLITHDLRESVYLSDEVVVLSDRPATKIYTARIDLGPERIIDDLYTPNSTELLVTLRHQIEVAQGRTN